MSKMPGISISYKPNQIAEVGITIDVYRSIETGPIILGAWDLDDQRLEDDESPITSLPP